MQMMRKTPVALCHQTHDTAPLTHRQPECTDFKVMYLPLVCRRSLVHDLRVQSVMKGSAYESVKRLPRLS